MRFNSLSTWSTAFAGSVLAFALGGCSAGPALDGPHDDFVIGRKLSDTSAANDQSQVVLFDKTVRIIHQFDMGTPSVSRSLLVKNPQAKHDVLFDQTTGMIADFSEGRVTTFDRNSVRTENPVELVGKAVSSAINSPLHRLVVYDDNSNIGLIQMDANAAICASCTFVAGPSFDNSGDASVTSGDLLDDGRLVVSLSNGKLAVIDFTATLAAQSWQATILTTTLTASKIKWVSPVHGSNDRVLVLTDETFALVSLADGSIIAKRDFVASESVAVMSKDADGHIVVQSSSAASPGLVLVYTNGTAILQKTLAIRTEKVYNSRYSQGEDTWAFIDSKNDWSWSYNAAEGELKDRHLRRFQVSNGMRAITNMALPDTAQLDISQRYVFALFPADMGFGQRLGINDGSSVVVRGFNAPYIGR